MVRYYETNDWNYMCRPLRFDFESTGNILTCELNLAGTKKADVSAQIKGNNVLVVKAGNEEYKAVLPDGYKVKGKASYENGLFSLSFEKKEKVKDVEFD